VSPAILTSRRRLVALGVVMMLAFAGVAVRVTLVQGLSWREYSELGESQRLRRVQLPAERGSLLDRNGKELAMTMAQRTVWANPRLVSDPAAEARALAPVLEMDEARLRDKLTESTTFTYLARRVSDDVATLVEALKLPGVSFIEEPKRFQPAGALAASILGQVGDDNEGLTGLELQFDQRLSGSPGELLVERDPSGSEIASGMREHRASKRGDDLMLTLDMALQYETERALAAQIVASKAKGGTVIVTDPRNGEVLAMANLVAGPEGAPPTPAPNNLGVTSVYEPGSVNKVITIAGALEEGVVKPADVLPVPDKLNVGGSMFRDHDAHEEKAWTVTDIVANSSNIGTIMIGSDLGKHRLDRYLRSFGLGATTALDFPGESPGLLIDPDGGQWSDPAIGTVPIGQGLAVTALQMLGAYNTVANGGTYVAPKLVMGSIDTDGKTHSAKPSARRRVVSSLTAQQMTMMLAEVTRVGTGKQAQIEGYTVAGKTGTAKKPVPGGAGYQDGAYVATFAGFTPAENPRLSVIVLIDEPTQGGYYGGEVAAPVFAQVARYALRQLRVPPPGAAPKVAVPPLADARPVDLDVERPRPVTPTTLATSPSPLHP
jgi:cell division protein FtsI (penicillin-binding protein 3)